MKVKEFIEILKALLQDAEVKSNISMFNYCEEYFPEVTNTFYSDRDNAILIDFED